MDVVDDGEQQQHRPDVLAEATILETQLRVVRHRPRHEQQQQQALHGGVKGHWLAWLDKHLCDESEEDLVGGVGGIILRVEVEALVDLALDADLNFADDVGHMPIK